MATQTDGPPEYRRRLTKLTDRVTGDPSSAIRLTKKTTSNLFRYRPRDRAERTVDLSDFDHVLAVDVANQIVEVEGLVTYKQLVSATLPSGLLPEVAPELEHITIGGAIVGIGIESTCFKHGFVHDGLVEADLLLADGSVVTARADNDHADLFAALGNSYGTLGYITRARLRLTPAKPFVTITNRRHNDIGEYLEAMEAATRSDADFVEGLYYADDELYLTIGEFADSPVSSPFDIRGPNIYYRQLRRDTTMSLPTADYIFRWDPDWFWNIPETRAFDLLRRYAPPRLRSSANYNRLSKFKRSYATRKGQVRDRLGRTPAASPAGAPVSERLIQDWQVAWSDAEEFIRFTLDTVDLADRPWMIVPIRTPGPATLYPIEPGELYLNVGCYCYVDRPGNLEQFAYTKMLDRRCFDLGGLKMLYSTTFVDESEFDSVYNGAEYRRLKAKYDPAGVFPTLYDKAGPGPDHN